MYGLSAMDKVGKNLDKHLEDVGYNVKFILGKFKGGRRVKGGNERKLNNENVLLLLVTMATTTFLLCINEIVCAHWFV